jgi:hypothetical protein
MGVLMVRSLNLCTRMAEQPSLTLVGRLSPTHTDYTAIAFGGPLIAAFLIVPPIFVVASTKLARRNRRSAIFVSLVPVALVALAIVVALVAHLPPVR